MDTCKRGHEMTPENTRVRPVDGYRTCRACNALRQREARAAGKLKPLTEEQKKRKAERERNRVRGSVVRSREAMDRRNNLKREKRHALAWEQAYEYYMEWYVRTHT